MRGIFRAVDSVKRVHFQTVGIFQRIISPLYDREICDLNEKFAAANYNFPPRIAKNIGSEKYKAQTVRQAGILTFDTSDRYFPLFFILFFKYILLDVYFSQNFCCNRILRVRPVKCVKRAKDSGDLRRYYAWYLRLGIDV